MVLSRYFKVSTVKMFQAFKFSFGGVDILVFLATFPNTGQTFIQFSGHTDDKKPLVY
jgi:hypothetical protein